MDELRRARPLLGTLVEISLPADADPALFERGFSAVETIQRLLSRFESSSEIARFHALAPGQSMPLSHDGVHVLRLAAQLQIASGGIFDVSQGSGPSGWQLLDGRLHKLANNVRLDLGGIAKGHAVDRAIATLRRYGARWGCVNAGGDLRVFGPRAVKLQLRDEQRGGLREFGMLEQGSFATSYFAFDARNPLHGEVRAPHVSVAAPRCAWADALTKIVAASGDLQHPLLARFGARAWLH